MGSYKIRTISNLQITKQVGVGEQRQASFDWRKFSLLLNNYKMIQVFAVVFCLFAFVVFFFTVLINREFLRGTTSVSLLMKNLLRVAITHL